MGAEPPDLEDFLEPWAGEREPAEPLTPEAEWAVICSWNAMTGGVNEAPADG